MLRMRGSGKVGGSRGCSPRVQERKICPKKGCATIQVSILGGKSSSKNKKITQQLKFWRMEGNTSLAIRVMSKTGGEGRRSSRPCPFDKQGPKQQMGNKEKVWRHSYLIYNCRKKSRDFEFRWRAPEAGEGEKDSGGVIFKWLSPDTKDSI